MSAALVAQTLAALETLEADARVGVVLMAGAEPGFCAGSDLAELGRSDPAGRRRFEADSGLLARRLTRFPKPVVAAVKGFAIGGGLTLAAACDVVVTEAASRWSLPEVPIGLFPAWGLEAVVGRIGRPAARRLSWGVDTLTGAEAVRLGLADQLAEDVTQEALELAQRLAALPRDQARVVKTYFAEDLFAARGDRRANQLFMRMGETAAAQTTFRKFASKA